MLDALRRGDRKGLAQAFLDTRLADKPGEHDNAVAFAMAGEAIEDLAGLCIELRRKNVAVLGSHEAFVRHHPNGSLHQVIMPVRLSLHNDTLYQLPSNTKVNEGTMDPWTKGNRWDWANIIREPFKANVAYQGLLQANAVAGCAVGQPPEVFVDGKRRTNPYVQRAEGKNGRLGDIIRVVISVNVVGPAPATGNPVVVQYTLDLDPGKDLEHMLMGVAAYSEDEAFLIEEDAYAAWLSDRDDRLNWKLHPLYGGVGIAHNLRSKDVRKCYQKFVKIMADLVKKAQTVARRNAMKAHPALAHHTVRVDENGNATIAVVGWAGETQDMTRYAHMMERMARGLLPDLEEAEVEVETIEAVYEPIEHATGEDDIDAVVDDDTVEDLEQAQVDRMARGVLILDIDQGLQMLSPVQVADLGYDPDHMSIEDLHAVLRRISAMVDEGAP